jgi:hypothetical protein
LFSNIVYSFTSAKSTGVDKYADPIGALEGMFLAGQSVLPFVLQDQLLPMLLPLH